MSNDRKRRINNRTVNTLEVETDTVFWDRRLAGFGVRAYPSGARVYIAQARGRAAPGGSRSGATGSCTPIGPRRAALAIARIVAGEDPVPQHTAAKAGAGPSVAEVAERYLREHTAVQCKPRTLQIRRTVIGQSHRPGHGQGRVGRGAPGARDRASPAPWPGYRRRRTSRSPRCRTSSVWRRCGACRGRGKPLPERHPIPVPQTGAIPDARRSSPGSGACWRRPRRPGAPRPRRLRPFGC